MFAVGTGFGPCLLFARDIPIRTPLRRNHFFDTNKGYGDGVRQNRPFSACMRRG